jgi:hypothetical protein
MARNSTQSRKGVSLAKGPVGIIGLIGVIYGLSALIFASHGFALHIPHGAVHGKKWIGLEVNGWSDLLFIAAGLLLLLSAPLHWGAKSMSLLVGLAMIAAAIVAIIRGNGVFGIFAANHLTELVWAAAGVLLLVLALLPRVGARDGGAQTDQRQGATASRSPVTRGSTEPVESASRRGSRPMVRRRETVKTSDANDQHTRSLQEAEPQERPRSTGVQTTNNHESR